MKTTMNAELSSEERYRIYNAWHTLTIMPLPPDPDIPAMLGHATAIITAAHELRRAIADGSYYANRRAFPEAPRAKRARTVPGTWDMAEAIRRLGITEAELEEFRRIREGR